MGERLPVGLVGCGRWGRHVLRDLVTLGCEVSVAARSEASRAHALGGGAVRVVDDVARLGGVAGVVVATPTAVHAGSVEAALTLGVPVFVEKPLTADPASAERLAARAPERVFVMDKWRYHPGVEELGAIARSGELGRPLGLETRRLGYGNPHAEVDAIWILAPHDLSIALEVLGHLPEPRAAVAECPGGVPAGLLGLLGGPGEPWLTLEVSACRRRHERISRLLCEGGAAVLGDGYADHVEITRFPAPLGREAPEPALRPISTEMPLLRELRAFVEHLRGGPPPRSSAAEGAAVVAAVARLRELAGLRAVGASGP